MQKAEKIILMLLIVVTILIRLMPAMFGYYDQESMVAITAMKLTIANNYVLPANYNIQGFVRPIAFGEKALQVYIVTMPYMLLNGFLSLLETVYLIKGIFTLMSLLIIFLFCRRITGNNTGGIFAILLFAIIPTAIFFQAADIWYGDSFLPVLTLGSILLLLYAKDNINDKYRFCLYSASSIILIVAAYFIWNGGAYAIVSYLLVLITLAINKMAHSFSKPVLVGIFLIIIGYSVYLPNINLGAALSTNTTYIFSSSIVLLTQQNPLLYLENPLTTTIAYPLILLAGLIIFALLPIYTVFVFSRKGTNEKKKEAVLIILMLLLLGIPAELTSTARFDSVIIMEIAILAGVSLSTEKRAAVRLLYSILITSIFIASIIQIISPTYPDNASPEYMSAINWISQNTATNSTILTYYYDAVPVEYSGRIAYTDPWSGYNAILVDQFSNFLFQHQCNFTYLEKLKPDYVLINTYWLYRNIVEYKFLAATSNVSNPTLNDSNLAALGTSNMSIVYNNTVLDLVYNENITKIYKVEFYPSNISKGVCRYANVIALR